MLPHARTLALCVCVALVLSACGADVEFGVLEEPERAQQLGTITQAALGASGTVRLAALEPGEPLAPGAAACRLAQAGMVAALAGGEPRALRHAAAAAARAGLPLLLVDPAPADATWEALELYPHDDALAEVCAELVRAKGWRSAVLLHEGGARAAALLTRRNYALALLARRLPPPGDEAPLRNLLLVLKKSGAREFLVWCESECVSRVLATAQRVGMLCERHSYVLVSLAMQARALSKYSHGGANITTLRLTDARAPDDPPSLGLAHAGATLAAATWHRLALPPAHAADCTSGTGAFHADTLLNYMRSEDWETTSWEADGGRRALSLDVLELVRGGRLERAGGWTQGAGLTWQRAPVPVTQPPPDSMTNRTFTVLIARNKPYVMKKESKERLTGNARYEGFCIELIEKLAELLQFNYTFIEVKGSYGTYNNVTQKWDGLLGRLIDDPDVDFAITDLTITAERERAVDFTTPFMNLGISILFRAPQQPEPKLFAFLHPFSNGVWTCLAVAYIGTSLLLYVIGRLCHEEWQNPYPCIEDPPALQNQFTLSNALWFNLGAVLLQGSEIAPVAYGTRAVASAWWLFALIITSSYTANLATLLAKKSNNELIHNVAELAYNNLGIRYGAKDGGSTFNFFQHSENKMYQHMYQQMLKEKMPESNEEGIKKVMTETYAFLMESTTIEYETQRNCEVVKVGSLLDSKGYGIAMKKNSTYRQALNLGLLSLQEAGVLREMQRSWWEEKHGGGACKPVEDRENERLLMKNFKGLFLVLVVGSGLGVVVSCCDLAWTSARRARDRNERFITRYWKELRFVLRFDTSERPLQGSLSGSVREETEQPTEETMAEEAAEETLEEAARSHRTRSGSFASRRRSSIHAASVRLARHTTPRR